MNPETTIEKIYKSSLKFLIPLSAEKTYETITAEAMRIVNFDHGSILLYIDTRLERVYASSHSFHKVIPRKNGYSSKAYTSRIPYSLDIKKIAKVHPNLAKLGIKSVLFIPLSYKNKAIGVLTLQSTKKEYVAEEDLETMKLFGAMASLSIRKTQLYDETQQALKMRNQFISLAAHELRTPLTSVIGYLQLLSKRISRTDSTSTKWLGIAYGESLKITNLINELMEVNNIASGKQHYYFSEYKLFAVIQKSIAKSQITYSTYKFALKTKINNDSLIVADENKLSQVFVSLLDNAAKFSSSEHPIKIVVSSNQKYFIAQIVDKGIGIKKEDLPHVFKEFYKAKDNTVVGMGLGLLLAKNIVDEHHGKIEIKSIPHKGTTVTVMLPKYIS